jgi:hypothetical protein
VKRIRKRPASAVRFFAFTAVIAVLMYCSKKASPTAPVENSGAKTETTAMKLLSDSLIVAFKSASAERVLGFVNAEFKDVYGEELSGSTADMTAFGEALKGRRLVDANELYAEYRISVGGETVTLAYANAGDGHWQLVRF